MLLSHKTSIKLNASMTPILFFTQLLCIHSRAYRLHSTYDQLYCCKTHSESTGVKACAQMLGNSITE